ncbi:unnamed protein product [Rotaria sordida]|uniref:Uncharacterized protein n=1 Tax=Rotaria sordida TaxID=392033 RepID=A0A813UUZ8_9BILA|nr:unnamed protein product [Rotaria sordida]
MINIDQPSRTKLVGYPGRMMLRDIKRRTLIRKYWPERFRHQLLRKNMVLPDSFKESFVFDEINPVQAMKKQFISIIIQVFCSIRRQDL